jgi:hypothetical protein
VHLVLGDEESVALVRQLTELAGGELAGAEPLAGPFVALWFAVRDALAALHRSIAVESSASEGEPEQGRTRTVRDRLRGRRRPPERPES